MYYVLFYKTVDKYLELREPFRKAHLELAAQAHLTGSLVMAGALDEPADEALLIFKSNGPNTAVDFARNDPYVKNGLISEWKVRPWTVVVGNEPES